MKKNLFIIFFIFLLSSSNFALDDQPVIRELEPRKDIDIAPPVSNLHKQVEIPQLSPKSIKIETIEKDTQIIEAPLIKEEPAPQIFNLGDAVDFLFFTDTNFTQSLEPLNLPKISFTEFVRRYSLCVELFNNKLYNEAIQEIDKLSTFILYDDARIKLLFLKTAAALENNNIQLAQQSLAQIETLDNHKKFSAERIYYNGQALEKNNNFDAAISEYLKVYKLHPENNYADNGLFFAAKLLAEKKENYPAATKYLDIIINNYQLSDYADDALFYKAQMYDNIAKIKDYSIAEDTYRKLYNLYPKSKHAVQAQERGNFIKKNYL